METSDDTDAAPTESKDLPLQTIEADLRFCLNFIEERRGRDRTFFEKKPTVFGYLKEKIRCGLSLLAAHSSEERVSLLQDQYSQILSSLGLLPLKTDQ